MQGRKEKLEGKYGIEENQPKSNAAFLTNAVKTPKLSFKKTFPCLSNPCKGELSLSLVGNRKERWMVTATFKKKKINYV